MIRLFSHEFKKKKAEYPRHVAYLVLFIAWIGIKVFEID